MVSSKFTGFMDSCLSKLINRSFLFPLKHIDGVDADRVKLDFSDVFGPVLLDEADSGNIRVEGERKIFFDDREVISHQSHSLVGPMYASQSCGLSQLTIHGSEDSEKNFEFISDHAAGKILGPSSDDISIKRNIEGLSLNPTKLHGVGTGDFEILKVVGAGAFAKVYQTKYRLYLVLDFVNGGLLFFQLYRHGLFREELALVYAAEIVSAVSHLHDNGIMHRDLKLENVLLDVDGHVMLTDFGLAKQFDANTRAKSMCGTVEYMSPEIVLGKGHDKATDWWSVGILVFEMLTGKPPFTGSRNKVQQKIVKDKIKLPAFSSSEAHSLLKGLLQKDASKRLGNGLTGGSDIKRHKWFKSINWEKLESRKIEPSFRPRVAGKHCVANFDKHWTDMPIADSPAASPRAGGSAFTGFSYVKPPETGLSLDHDP